jgi:hypothetical protein
MPYTCSKDLYVNFLKITSQRYSAFSLSEVSPVELSHDAVSSWLVNTKFQPKNIWTEAKDVVLGSSGVIIIDETVISKTRSNKIELVHWLYSGNEHDVIKGIGVLNFLWNNLNNPNVTIPFDYRIYEPIQDGKTKNDHLRETLILAKKRGVIPEAVIADSWFSSLDNLKLIRDLGWVWVMGLRKNRKVNKNENLENLVIPEEGLKIHLRGYGWIYVFKFVAKNGRIDFIGTNLDYPTSKQIKNFVGMRWSIETFHRELKQTCGLEDCQARSSRSQRNHIGLSILCWMKRANQRSIDNLSFYNQSWNTVKPSIKLALKIQMHLT